MNYSSNQCIRKNTAIFTIEPLEPSIRIQRQNLPSSERAVSSQVPAIWHQRTVCCFQERRLEKAQHTPPKRGGAANDPLEGGQASARQQASQFLWVHLEIIIAFRAKWSLWYPSTYTWKYVGVYTCGESVRRGGNTYIRLRATRLRGPHRETAPLWDGCKDTEYLARWWPCGYHIIFMQRYCILSGAIRSRESGIAVSWRFVVVLLAPSSLFNHPLVPLHSPRHTVSPASLAFVKMSLELNLLPKGRGQLPCLGSIFTSY